MLKESQDTNTITTVENHTAADLSKNFTDTTALNISIKHSPHFLYQEISSKFFNEMRDHQVMNSQAGQRLEEWLSQHTLDELNQLNEVAKEHFLYDGITFTVYGDEQGTERTIPFDVIPRVIARKQWNMVALGSAQRVQALNLFLHDIYHQQDILKANIVP